MTIDASQIGYVGELLVGDQLADEQQQSRVEWLWDVAGEATEVLLLVLGGQYQDSKQNIRETRYALIHDRGMILLSDCT